MDSFNPMGEDMFGDAVVHKGLGPLGEKYMVPPFSVLDVKAGQWAARKKAWIGLGIDSERGRDVSAFDIEQYKGKSYDYMGASKTNASIFDPVLCEIMYDWFCPPGGQIVDSFAGGSVRGLIAGFKGYSYWGCDIRAEQVEANIVQAVNLAPDRQPVWTVGDSLRELQYSPEADFLFTCPPYGDLEVYSDDENDISTMSATDFLLAYGKIIKAGYDRLKNNRFAAIVVGDYRDKTGALCNFVGNTVQLHLDAGFKLYNEAVLLTPIGTLPVRTSAQFKNGCKLGKAHQNVLVFVKGDIKKAEKTVKNGDK